MTCKNIDWINRKENSVFFDVNIGIKSNHPNLNKGSNLCYIINGVEGAELILEVGRKYLFSFNFDYAEHPFIFTRSKKGGHKATFIEEFQLQAEEIYDKNNNMRYSIIFNNTDDFYYQCTNHIFMGGEIKVLCNNNNSDINYESYNNSTKKNTSNNYINNSEGSDYLTFNYSFGKYNNDNDNNSNSNYELEDDASGRLQNTQFFVPIESKKVAPIIWNITTNAIFSMMRFLSGYQDIAKLYNPFFNWYTNLINRNPNPSMTYEQLNNWFISGGGNVAVESSFIITMNVMERRLQNNINQLEIFYSLEENIVSCSIDKTGIYGIRQLLEASYWRGGRQTPGVKRILDKLTNECNRLGDIRLHSRLRKLKMNNSSSKFSEINRNIENNNESENIYVDNSQGKKIEYCY